MKRSVAVAACLLLALAGGARAETGASAWSVAQLSSTRLIAAGGGLHAGHYDVAIEINLKAGAHTYWRNPGDAGVAPVIETAGSVNLAGARPLFPPPARLREDGADVFGYVGAVTIPLEITPADPARPVTLALRLRYAACERICVPEEADLRLDVAPRDPEGPFAARVAQALAAAP